MNNLPTTGELFATNQVSVNTERCYKRQLHNFAEWMSDSGLAVTEMYLHYSQNQLEQAMLADLLSVGV